jgi:hypothetical protein
MQRQSRAAFIQRWAPFPHSCARVYGRPLCYCCFLLPFLFAGGAFTWLIDHAGPVKQFRALGVLPGHFITSRVATLLIACTAYGKKQVDRGVPRWQLAWLPLVLAWLGRSKALSMSLPAPAKYVGSPGPAAYSTQKQGLGQQLSWLNRRPDDFQAILPLPYFHLGTDKFAIHGSEASFHQSYNLAFTTGLPLLANHTTRASVGSAMHHVQLLSSPLIARTLLTRLPSEKPILLLVTPGNLTPAEERIQGLARQLMSVLRARFTSCL